MKNIYYKTEIVSSDAKADHLGSGEARTAGCWEILQKWPATQHKNPALLMVLLHYLQHKYIVIKQTTAKTSLYLYSHIISYVSSKDSNFLKTVEHFYSHKISVPSISLNSKCFALILISFSFYPITMQFKIFFFICLLSTDTTFGGTPWLCFGVYFSLFVYYYVGGFLRIFFSEFLLR